MGPGHALPAYVMLGAVNGMHLLRHAGGVTQLRGGLVSSMQLFDHSWQQ